jgi:putative drug exporter of the RND superfamily
MSSLMLYRWGVAVARHRRAALACWALALALCAVLYPSLQGALGAPSYAVEGSESQRVEQLLGARFHAIGTEDDALVFYSSRHLASASAYRGVIAAALATARRQRGVHGVLGPYDSGAVGQISSNEHAAVAVVALDGGIRQRYDYARALQQTVGRTARNGVSVWLTGYSPLAVDLASLSKTDVERAELIGVPVAFLVLLIALDAFVAAAATLLLAGAGLLAIYGLLAVLATAVNFDSFLLSIVTMIGIGLGIDYVLFAVSRFREELARGDLKDGETDGVAGAVGRALATTGRTLIFSGAIVAISLASLAVVNGPFFREIAIGALVVVTCMLAVVLTLLPAVMATLGPRVNRGSLRSRMRHKRFRTRAQGAVSGRWAAAMMRRPLLAAGAAVIVLMAATVPLLSVHYGLNIGVFSLSGSPSGKGESVLARYFSPGAVSPIQVVVANQDGRPLSAPALAGGQAMARTLEDDPRISAVSERQDDGGLLLTVVPSVAIDTPAATAIVAHIRRDLAPSLRRRWHALVLVGGATAFDADLTAEVRAKLPVVLALILGLSLLCLLVVFRSVAIPVKAVVMNLLSTGAAMGLVVLVFQDGHGQHLLGFTSTGFIQAYMPLLVFALLFGLSMDYEVFLVRRVQEEWRRTGENRAAIIGGVEHTALPIVAAASIMVVVFGSFVTADLLEIKQLGFALAIAVAIDASLVRLVLVPAVMGLLGDRNWWLPARLERLLPRVAPLGRPPAPERGQLAGQDASQSTREDPLGVISVDGSTFGYEDVAGVRRPLI